MTQENRLDLLAQALDGLSEDDLALAMQPPAEKRRRLRPVILSAAACAAALLAAVGLQRSGLFDEKLPAAAVSPDPSVTADSPEPTTAEIGDSSLSSSVSDGSTSPVQSTAKELQPLLPWASLSPGEQYGELTFSGLSYCTRAATAAAAAVGESLGTVTLSAADEDGRAHTAEASVHPLHGIARRCALAVRFAGTDAYWVYVNSDYRPATFGDFLRDLNLPETAGLGPVYADGQNESGQFVLLEWTGDEGFARGLRQLLLTGHDSAPAAADFYSGIFPAVMSVQLNVPLLGYTNIALWVTEDGWLATNLLDTGKAFYIGEEQTAAIITYVEQNGTRHTTVIDPATPSAQTEAPADNSAAVNNGDTVTVSTSGARR